MRTPAVVVRCPALQNQPKVQTFPPRRAPIQQSIRVMALTLDGIAVSRQMSKAAGGLSLCLSVADDYNFGEMTCESV